LADGQEEKGRVARHATRAKSAHEGSDAEESESGALSGTSSEKQRLFETHAQLREAKQVTKMMMMIMMILTLQTRRTSDSRHALRIYNAAVDDLETSAEDIAFLRSIFETERQADFDRANPVAFAAFTGAAYIDFSDQD
jgi:hypothetical protein